jgi:heme/copper-type cytochrome/quinol oxidase subunit 2
MFRYKCTIFRGHSMPRLKSVANDKLLFARFVAGSVVVVVVVFVFVFVVVVVDNRAVDSESDSESWSRSRKEF